MSELNWNKMDDKPLAASPDRGMRVPGMIYANEKIYQLLKAMKVPAGWPMSRICPAS